MRRARNVSALLVVVALVAACASVAPGSDPFVVRGEQTLAMADALYADGMAYYFSPGAAASLSPRAIAVFETVRTRYDGPYKAAQKAIDTYKAASAAMAAAKAAGNAADVAAQLAALSTAHTQFILAADDLATLVNQVLAFLPSASAPKSGLKPVAAGGK